VASGQVGLRRVIEEKPFEEQGVVRPAFWDGFSLDTIRLDVVVTGLWIMISMMNLKEFLEGLMQSLRNQLLSLDN
jgi:hypothetical protein